MANSIEGWYPQPDGTLRWWDGQQWTDRSKQRETAVADVAPASETTPRPTQPAKASGPPTPTTSNNAATTAGAPPPKASALDDAFAALGAPRDPLGSNAAGAVARRCLSCGKVQPEFARACDSCGGAIGYVSAGLATPNKLSQGGLGQRGVLTSDANEPSRRTRAIYIVLALLLGMFGIHNFYAGRNGAGALQLGVSTLAIALSVAGGGQNWFTLVLLAGVGIAILIEIVTVELDGESRLLR